MKCPKCVEEGKKSKVFVQMGETTLLGSLYSDYYDEEGRNHMHDPNTTKMHYTCSNGHKWSAVEKRRCPVHGCDYGKKDTCP